MPFPLEPKSIAVIGASADEKKLGHAVLKNIVKQGYKGKVYPINPKADEILGKQSYASVADVSENIEMAVVVTPAQTVPEIMEECGKKKISLVVVISAGFGETHTEEGEKREKEVARIAREYGINLIGPNCLGVIRPRICLNASFAITSPAQGNIALLSQSGALAVAIMDESSKRNLGYSCIISMGNKTVLDAADFLEWCETDDETHVIGLYVEDIKDGERFREVTSRIAESKPIVMIKSGISERGKQAVSSHTGALAGSDAAITAICAQTGIRRAADYEEFLDMLHVLSMQPPLLSRNIAVITNAGGPGILATDAADKYRLALADLTDAATKSLKSALPEAASVKNPVDVLGDADALRYEAALNACGADKNVDGVVAVLTPQVMTPCTEIAQAIIRTAKKYPLMPVVTSFMGNDSIQQAIEELHNNGIPNYTSPDSAMRALASLREPDHTEWKPRPAEESYDDRASAALEVIGKTEGFLDELIIQDLFALYGIEVPKQGIAKTAKEAAAMAVDIGFPVIAKISSPDLPHKTDIGGVRADLKTAKQVETTYKEIMDNVKKHAPAAGVNGILIQQFLPIGHELIVGAVRDPTFGPLIMAGLGGIYTELMKDTAFRLAPLTKEDVYDMLQELKAWKLLLGLRGGKQLDIESLADLVMTASDIMMDCPAIREIDVNPVLVKPHGYTVADVKVRVAKSEMRFQTS